MRVLEDFCIFAWSCIFERRGFSFISIFAFGRNEALLSGPSVFLLRLQDHNRFAALWLLISEDLDLLNFDILMMQVHSCLSLLLSLVKSLFKEGSDIDLEMFSLRQRFTVLLSHLVEHVLIFLILLGVEVETDGLVWDLSRRTEDIVHFFVIFELEIEILDYFICCFESLLMQLYLTC